jgi:hypothetical protein
MSASRDAVRTKRVGPGVVMQTVIIRRNLPEAEHDVILDESRKQMTRELEEVVKERRVIPQAGE